MSPSPGQKVSNILLGKSGEQLLIAPERMGATGPKQKQGSAVSILGSFLLGLLLPTSIWG